MVLSLQEKSLQSFNSAKFLFKQPYYPSTVNRAYYSCIQLLFHILFYKQNLDRKKFDNDRKKFHKGSHEWAIYLISNQIQEKHFKDFKWFKDSINAIKEMRVKSDYYDDIINQEMATLSISKADSIINFINLNFK